MPNIDADVDPDGLRDFCKGQIAHYKVPLHIRPEECIANDDLGQAPEIYHERRYDQRTAMIRVSRTREIVAVTSPLSGMIRSSTVARSTRYDQS